MAASDADVNRKGRNEKEGTGVLLFLPMFLRPEMKWERTCE
jgi:hypothetical protein